MLINENKSILRYLIRLLVVTLITMTILLITEQIIGPSARDVMLLMRLGIFILFTLFVLVIIFIGPNLLRKINTDVQRLTTKKQYAETLDYLKRLKKRYRFFEIIKKC